ncbi:MAG: Gfo/Idh/MocA family oxidoreductase [Thermoguttaceae bacterium]|nr:Gfo/Idh/MocA family oxidoreductase [Thermoguttaceae bacterium]
MQNRRDFLKTSAVEGAGFLVASGNFRKQARASALQSVAVVGVGVGGKGGGDITHAGYYGKVVGICDVDKRTLEGKSKEFPDAKTYVDFRDMYDELGDKFDAATIGTPDHMHAIQTATAMKMGKHVYTQKPLTRTIYEARWLGELAKKTGVCAQMGNQGSVDDGLRKNAAQYRAGVIGDISEVHVWTNRPIWAQGPNRAMTIAKFTEQIKAEDPEIAEDEIAGRKKQIADALKVLDWDAWLGVAPKREFWPGIYHSFQWRGWWDFGTGALGDMACHNVNMIFKGVDLRNPTSVQATSSGHDFDSFPARSATTFEFPANDWRGPIKFVWYDASQTPSKELMAEYGFENVGDNNTFVIGSKGAGLGGSFREKGGKEIPRLKDEDVDFVIAPIDAQGRGDDARHKYEWFNAIWEGKPEICWSNFADHAGPLTETILLGNLAIWAAPKADEIGEKIEWDAKNLKITNIADLKTPGLEELVKPVYKNGYDPVDELF